MAAQMGSSKMAEGAAGYQVGQETGSMESLVGRRVRVNGNLATALWGPGELQAPPPPAKKGASKEAQPATEGSETVPPPPTMMTVVGIAYDAPGLGKHDGMYQKERLFTCEAGHGAFAKVEKVDVGVSLQAALVEKYFAALREGMALKSRRSEEIDTLGQDGSMSVEMVGRYDIEQRQKEIEVFKEMSLSETNFETRYPEDVWQFDWSLPNLKSLWLDKTLISNWADIIAICKLCPRLEWMSLARTRLQALPDDGSVPLPVGAPETADARIARGTFACRIQTLVLSSTGISWKDILALDYTGCFPCLEHLHLAQNGLTEGVPEISCREDGNRPLSRIKTLVLDSNGVSDWFVLKRAVAAFPLLEELHLNGNSLGGSLDGLMDVSVETAARCLTKVFLSENKLSSWQAVGAVSCYALLELKVQRNPMTEGDKPLASPQLLRQVLIALMPTLTRLNNSEVNAKERLAAERYFLALVQNKDHLIIQALGETCAVDSHASRLKSLYADVVGEFLVEVTLEPFGAELLDQKPVVKKVPHTMTIAELKALAHKSFGEKVPVERMQLLLVDPAVPFGTPFADESRDLGFYGVMDGARLRVDDSADNYGDKMLKAVDNTEKQMLASDKADGAVESLFTEK